MTEDRTSSPTIAVVIACRDRAPLLAGALDAVGIALRPGDAVVVADSASRDQSVTSTARRAGALVVRCDRPGASRARNAGAAAARADVLAFTDDDCRPEPGWLEALATAFADRDVDFVVGPVLGDGPSTLASREPMRFRGLTDPVDIGHGANLACRADAFAAVGGFDERLGPGARWPAAEDHDLMWRLLGDGRVGAFAPAARVGHQPWRGAWATAMTEYRYGVGAAAFAVKAGGAGDALLARRRAQHGPGAVVADVRRRWLRAALADGARFVGLTIGARSARRAGLTASGPRRHAG